MALVRRHWKLALLNCLLILAAVGLLVHRLMRSGAVAQTPPSPATQPSAIDAVSYCRVQDLRGRLFLTNRDLAAMGCTQEQAAGVLSALLQWHSTNQSSFEQIEQSQRSAQQQLADAIRRVNSGPRNATLLNQVKTLQQQEQSANAQRQALVEQAMATIQSHLTSAQQQIWQTARSNAAVAERYRYLSDLSAAASAALSAAAVKYGAGSPQAQQVEQSVLGTRLNDLNTSIAAIGQNIAAVIAAEAAVLPVPEDRKTPSTPLAQ
jgi:hypothetical protein